MNYMQAASRRLAVASLSSIGGSKGAHVVKDAEGRSSSWVVACVCKPLGEGDRRLCDEARLRGVEVLSAAAVARTTA